MSSYFSQRTGYANLDVIDKVLDQTYGMPIVYEAFNNESNSYEGFDDDDNPDMFEDFDPNATNVSTSRQGNNISVSKPNPRRGYPFYNLNSCGEFGCDPALGGYPYDFGMFPYSWRAGFPYGTFSGGAPYNPQLYGSYGGYNGIPVPMQSNVETTEQSPQTVTVTNKNNASGQRLANTQLSLLLLAGLGVGILFYNTMTNKASNSQ